MSCEVTGLTVDVAARRHVPARRIVDGVSLRVGDGERVGLVGPSGSGKSMVARSVVGILPPHLAVGGSVKLGGTEMVGAGDEVAADLRGRYVSMVFQNPGSALNPVRTVGQAISLPLVMHYDLEPGDVHDRVLRAMRSVELPERLTGAYPHQLSGGQRQRVAIAAALVTSPRLIIADEPTTALDAIVQREIVDLLVSLVDDLGASLLFITHDFSVLAHATTRCYVMDAGRVVEEGATQGILRRPRSSVARLLVRAANELSLHGEGPDGADMTGAGGTAGGATGGRGER